MIDHEGNKADLVYDESLDHQLRHRLEQTCWHEASLKRLGSGLAQAVPNLAPARNVKQQFVNEGLHTEAAYVEKLWPQDCSSASAEKTLGRS